MNSKLRTLVVSLVGLILSGCGAVLGIGSPVRLVSSLPWTGTKTTIAKSIDDGIQYALAEHGMTAGRYTLAYESWDNARGEPTTDWWQEFSNAYRAVANKSVVAYIGVPTSYAARSTIPILNEGGPLVMVSPLNAYPGFTKKYQAAEPEMYYPVGRRNFARVIPSADTFAASAARWVKTKGFESVAILNDNEWDNRALAQSFESEAKSLGMTILAHETYSPALADQNAVSLKIAALDADVVFLAADESSNPGAVMHGLRAGGWNGAVLTLPSLSGNSFVKSADAEGAYIMLAGTSVEEVANTSAEGKKWYDGYAARIGNKPDYQSLQAYEATRIVLRAIDACTAKENLTRLCVTEETLATKNFKSLSGSPLSFDANGDTTTNEFHVYIVKNGELQRVGALK